MRASRVVLASAAILALVPAQASQSSCVARVVYDHVGYTGSHTKHAVHRGAWVGTGVLPACHDLIINGQPAPGERDTPVSVYRAGRAHPKIALMIRGDGDRSVYLAAGFLIESPKHPLHRAIYGSASEPDAGSDPGCGKRLVRSVGRVRYPVESGRIDLAGRERDRAIRIDTHTKLRGRTRLGVPYVGLGDHVVATGVRCGPELVARSVRWTRG